MSRCYFAVLLLPLMGCARQSAPAVAAVPTATPIATRAPIIVIAPPLPTAATPTPDPDFDRMQAVVVRELERLRSASPQNDLEATWARNDARFIGLNGFGAIIPGVPEPHYLDVIKNYGVKTIEGTTDGEFSPEVTQLNQMAARYAESYNRLLLAKLDERDKAR